jgi:hypothetical protein
LALKGTRKVVEFSEITEIDVGNLVMNEFTADSDIR